MLPCKNEKPAANNKHQLVTLHWALSGRIGPFIRTSAILWHRKKRISPSRVKNVSSWHGMMWKH